MKPPLLGMKIVEFEGLGPVPLVGRMLLDMGAEVTLIRRPHAIAVAQQLGGGFDDCLHANKAFVTLDLKQSPAREQSLDLISQADALIEGTRPGVMERLELGPAQCAARNPRIVYGRMTGWGQSGPLAHAAGHDLNYVALSGLLSLSAHRGERPIAPPTVLGDAAGALGLAFGMVCALFDAARTGRGRVVDGAIVDVLGMLGTLAMWVRANGQLDAGKPSVFHDSPFYEVYACADGRFLTVAALEPQFYKLLLEILGLHDVSTESQYDRQGWPALKARLRLLFLTQPLAHWRTLLEGTDACFAPVLTLSEAASHPHNAARGVYSLSEDGTIQTHTAPRFMPLT
jgi:alpha-methylacyl-CoA racemase